MLVDQIRHKFKIFVKIPSIACKTINVKTSRGKLCDLVSSLSEYNQTYYSDHLLLFRLDLLHVTCHVMFSES